MNGFINVPDFPPAFPNEKCATCGAIRVEHTGWMKMECPSNLFRGEFHPYKPVLRRA